MTQVRQVFAAVLFCFSAVARGDANGGTSLADLAARADLVAVGQVRDTDYARRDNLPFSGSAYLEVLIPYKSDNSAQLVEVFEQGRHEGACYFPTPSVFEEGRRYLLFLRHDPGHPERFRGLPEGCAIDVLVTSDNRYAVRLPVTGIALSDPLGELAEAMTFSDPYAVAEDAAWAPGMRDSLREAHLIAPCEAPTGGADEASPEPRMWCYTSGIELGALRPLLKLLRFSIQAP